MAITSAIEYKQLPGVAQGWVTGGEYADNGDLISRADTTTGWFKPNGAAKHNLLLSPGVNASASDFPTNIDTGRDNAGYEAALCVENSNYRALISWGKLWLMTDGANWVVNTAAQTHIDAMYAALDADLGFAGSVGNYNVRPLYRRIAFDPKNPAVIGIVLQGYGLIYTLNGGTSWTKHANIPASTLAKNHGMAIAFDRSSTVTLGKTQRILVYSGFVGGGVYVTTGGFAGSFTKITGSPENVTCMKVSKINGHIWVAGTAGGAGAPSTGAAMRYDGSAWTTVTANSDYVVIHPTNSAKVFLLGGGGSYSSIANALAGTPTVIGETGHKIVSPDIPVLAWEREDFMSSGDADHHPTLERITMFEGIGMFDLNNPPVTAQLTIWNENCKGVENLVVQTMEVTGNSRVIKCSHDRPWDVRGYGEVDKYPATHAPDNTTSIRHSNQVGWATDDPDYLVGACTGTDVAYVSTNGGRSTPWTPTQPNGTTQGSGMMAVGNKPNAVWSPTDSEAPQFTINGIDWNLCDFGAAANAALRNPASTLSHYAYFIKKTLLLADRRHPDTFYIFITARGDDPTNPAIGRWKSVDKGATWTLISSSYIISSGYDHFNSRLKQEVTHEGHFWYTSGPTTGVGTYRLRYSFNGMATFTELTTGPTEVTDFSFGKNVAGAAYPIIYAHSEGFGVYKCENFNPANVGAETWQLITRFPYNMADAVNTVAADPNHCYRHYIGFGGAGAIYGDRVNRLSGVTVQLGS